MNTFDIFNEFIRNTIKEINDISIIDLFQKSNYLELQKKGVNYICCCPFHNEKTPSFTISAAKNIYKCFGCGETGDFIEFVKKFEGYNYNQEAILHIANYYLNRIMPENPYNDYKFNITPKKTPIKTVVLNSYDKDAVIILEKNISDYNKYNIANFKPQKIKENLLFELRNISNEFLNDCFDFSGLEYQNNFGEVKKINVQNITHYSNDKSFINIYCNWSSELKEKYKSLPKYMNLGNLTNQYYCYEFNTQFQTTYVSEGKFNALSIKQIHKDSNSICLFASTNIINDKEKFKIIFENKRIILAYDNDKVVKDKSNAGYKGMINTAKFIIDNYNYVSLEFLEYPVKVDANDLLRSGSLEFFLSDVSNYKALEKEFINKEYCFLNDLPYKEQIKEIIDNELEDMIKETVIDLDAPPKKDTVLLSIRKSNVDSRLVEVLSAQNISLIKGKAKSKKTYFMSLIAAALVSNGCLSNTLYANMQLNKNFILHIDTEQSKYHTYRVTNRIKRLVTSNINDNFASFSVRGYDADKIVRFTSYLVKKLKQVGFLIIDQLADLLNSINDEKEVVKLSKFYEKLSKEYDLHIIFILHENQLNEKAAGWAGTHFLKKAETVFKLVKDEQNKNITKVIADYTRNEEFDEFAFFINEHGLPEITNEYQISKNNDI